MCISTPWSLFITLVDLSTISFLFSILLRKGNARSFLCIITMAHFYKPCTSIAFISQY
uniref:Uncharacterized protein n=1 Tax=Rhizophora mucronata TaxID=61149 RepID=A0A2P2NNE1_RHIMU